ncbi:hypothetical protein M0804_015091 [Polistes exclamans]|nr:hypothetical protein M0804_015093 [Polistes exclamans]KAI4473947.1 hypothetical protein M0804_015091 [Polistes exclamans]
MEKENSASGGGGGGEAAATATSGSTSTSEKLQADQANPLLDPTALFGALAAAAAAASKQASKLASKQAAFFDPTSPSRFLPFQFSFFASSPTPFHLPSLFLFPFSIPLFLLFLVLLVAPLTCDVSPKRQSTTR